MSGQAEGEAGAGLAPSRGRERRAPRLSSPPSPARHVTPPRGREPETPARAGPGRRLESKARCGRGCAAAPRLSEEAAGAHTSPGASSGRSSPPNRSLPGDMSEPGTPEEMERAAEEERPPPTTREGNEEEEVAAAARTSELVRRRSASSLDDDDEEEEVAEATVVAGGGCREQDLTYELQQGYRILGEFLQEKHRGLTAPFLQPLGGVAAGEEEVAEGRRAGGRGGRVVPPQPGQGMCLLKMEEKFSSGQYRGITEFVSDFRLMLETCYRLHGVDHWISKQGQKLEMLLEQKLALLSR